MVARFLLENLYSAKSTKVLDPRFMFVIQTKTRLWLWIGSQVPKANIEKYQNVAHQTANMLQEHERANKVLQTVNQGEEGAEFWQEFGLTAAPAQAFQVVPEWTKDFIDVSVVFEVNLVSSSTQRQSCKACPS